MRVNGINDKNVRKVLNAYLKQFDCVAKRGECFEIVIDDDKSTIYYSYLIDKDADRDFQNFILDTFEGATRYNDFIIALFHEIGHQMTWDDFDDTETNFCLDEVARLTEEINKTKDETKKTALRYEYYNLPIERTATEWALWYIENHYNEVHDLWNLLVAEIQKVYKNMGLTEF